MSAWQVAGQDRAMSLLKRSLETNSVAHAYLFSGPRGTGKTTVARILAKAVNCANLAGNFEKNSGQIGIRRSEAEADSRGIVCEPCNTCDACLDISSGQSLDLVEIDAASSRGIDEIRALRDAIRLSPLKNKYKVYVVDECHMLTREAFNALLKTLEEPPSHAIFVLATTEFEKVPETIASRCQHFEFRKVSENIIRESLREIAQKENINIDDEAVGLLAFFADGSLRDGHNLLGQIISLPNDKIDAQQVRLLFGAPSRELVEGLIQSFIDKDSQSAFSIIKKAVDSGIDARLFLKFILRDIRSMLLLALAPNMEKELKGLLGENEFRFLQAAKDRFKPEELEFILRTLLDAYTVRPHFYLPQIPLELAVIKIISH